jgi:glycosyltransferase involved in cell wall biosynthesis
LPVLEAMTVGLPVVAANRGALPEVLGGAGLLFDAEDPDALAVALDRVLDDGDLAEAAAAKGVQRSRQFRWSDTAVRVLETYRHAIDQRRTVR